MDNTLPGRVQIRLLTLQFVPSLGGFDARPLDALVADKEVLDLREHFFTVGATPYLACLLTLRPVQSVDPPRNAGTRTDRIELSDEERPLFETLRTWRAERARADGVPAYLLFSNRELASIVRARPQSRSALLGLSGIGEKKVERYGGDVLRLCNGTTDAES